MKKILKSTLQGLLLIALATPGFAENRKGAYTLSPFVGGYTFDNDQDLETSPTHGLRAGYNFTRHWGAEAVFGYVLTETEATNMETDSYSYGLDALYHFRPDRNLVPFIAAGGGGNSLHTPHGIDDSSEWLFNYGLGLKYFITDSVALRGDVRHVLVFDDDTLNNLEYSAGVTFLLGGEKKAVAAMPPAADTTADNIAPTVSFTSPANGDTSVPVNKKINVAFTETMDPATITTATLTLKQGKALVSGKMTFAGTTATFNPANDLEKGMTYTATVAAGAKDLAGNGLANDYVWSFTTVPVPKVAAAPKVLPTVLIALEDSHFDYNSAEITNNGKTILNLNIKALKENPKIKIRIAGYASASGTEEYNQKLSERRANAVKEYIVKEGGIGRNRLTTIGYGESSPTEYEAVPSDIYSEAAKANMRVLFEVIVK